MPLPQLGAVIGTITINKISAPPPFGVSTLAAVSPDAGPIAGLCALMVPYGLSRGYPSCAVFPYACSCCSSARRFDGFRITDAHVILRCIRAHAVGSQRQQVNKVMPSLRIPSTRRRCSRICQLHPHQPAVVSVGCRQSGFHSLRLAPKSASYSKLSELAPSAACVVARIVPKPSSLAHGYFHAINRGSGFIASAGLVSGSRRCRNPLHTSAHAAIVTRCWLHRSLRLCFACRWLACAGYIIAARYFHITVLTDAAVSAPVAALPAGNKS
jgi:hypothetical protein